MAAVFAGGWIYLHTRPADSPEGAGLRLLVRRAVDWNARVFARSAKSPTLTKTYPLSAAAKNVRVNGSYGVRNAADTANWALHVARAPGDTLVITMADIKALPKTEIVFDFKCIEGWDQVTHWGGVRLSDFLKHFNLENAESFAYMGLRTPDGGYYVGIDMASALHPQTLLCYEMNNAPLPMDQGYPLRLIIPVKYGIKHLKRIGVLWFSNTPPPDFWAERGYDYYSGL